MQENPYESPLPDASVETVTRPKLSVEQLKRLEWEIEKQANSSVIAGALGIVMIFFVPMALICSRNATRLIEEHNVGHQCLSRAKLGSRLAYYVVLIVVVLICLFLGVSILAPI